MGNAQNRILTKPSREGVVGNADIAFSIVLEKMILLINSPSGLRMCFLVSTIFKRTAFAALTCVFATVGALVGCAAGALIGQTKEIGCARGARIGAHSGAALSIEMLESTTAVGGQWSLMDIFVSLVNGKIFQEWVGEAMLAANEPQGSMVRSTLEDHLCIFDIGNTRGMLPDSVKKLPTFVFSSHEKSETSRDDIPCAICLQDFSEGDAIRRLPKCRHHFHMSCIDRWLTTEASCPTCRQHVS